MKREATQVAAPGAPVQRLPHVSARQLATLRGFFTFTQRLSPRLAAAAAFRLFLRTFRHPLRAEDGAILARATRHELRAGIDSIVVYEWAGAGPTAIILHGWGSSAARFTLLAQALHARGWRVLAVDAPGHGASGSNSSSLPQFMAALDEVVARCGPPRALIGHSLGALAIACRHTGGPPAWARDLAAIVLISMPVGAEYLIRKYIEALGLSAATEQRLLQRFRARFHAEPRDFQTMPGASRATARLLLVHDRQDDIVPYDHSVQLHRQVPGAVFLGTDGQGHSKLTRDTTTIARIVEFIDSSARTP